MQLKCGSCCCCCITHVVVTRLAPTHARPSCPDQVLHALLPGLSQLSSQHFNLKLAAHATKAHDKLQSKLAQVGVLMYAAVIYVL